MTHSNNGDERPLAAQPAAVKGRGAASNATGRFESIQREAVDDGWSHATDPGAEPEWEPPPLRTVLKPDNSRTVITWNDSPDIPFDRSINPYRGCEHGCIYCYARPSHAWLGLSPGLDFESRLFFKANAAALLSAELSRPRYVCDTIALGANTDPYQPAERGQRVTRSIVQVLADCAHPLRIITKGALVERDIDLLAPMAEQNLCSVYLSITTLDRSLARRMEPRAAAPERRLRAIERLSAAGIPVGVLVAPVIPVLSDSELETILEQARQAGASTARYILIRLPLEVRALFREWLHEHYPMKAEHVMRRIRDTRGGRDYDSTYGQRMSGTGKFAELLEHRFKLAIKRLGYGAEVPLDTSGFKPPTTHSSQLSLF